MSKSNAVNKNPAITLVDAQKGMAIRCFNGERDLINVQLQSLLAKCFTKTNSGEMVSTNVNFIYTSNNGIKVISIPLIAFLGSNLITTESFSIETSYSLSSTNVTSYDSSSNDKTNTSLAVGANLSVSGTWGPVSLNVSSNNNLTKKTDNTVDIQTKNSTQNQNSITINTVMEFERTKDMFISDIISSLSNTSV
jgi:hypothetical protein